MQQYQAVLRSKNFLKLWISQILSQLTINIMNFLLLVHLFSKTKSTIATSLLWIAYALPAILVGPIAAVSVDLIDRRKILIITNLIQAVIIGLYALIHAADIFLLYVVVFAYSFFNQFYLPAENSTLPSVVNKKLLANANSLFFLTQQGSIVLGFGLAGILDALIGFKSTLILCSLALLAAFVSVSFLPKINQTITLSFGFFKTPSGFFKRIKEGFSFLKSHKPILLPFIMLVVLQISLAVIIVTVPVFATDILNISISYSGIAAVVPAGIGALLAALYIPKLLNKKIRKKEIILNSLLTLGFTLLYLGIFIPFISKNFKYLLSFPAIIIAGFSFVGILVSSQTYLQEYTPGGLRGRIFGNFWFITTTLSIVPVVFSAALTQFLGIRTLLVCFGLLILTLFFYAHKFTLKYFSGEYV